jgi:DsbC/DsbD-like thiol-disulfide interchange protein
LLPTPLRIAALLTATSLLLVPPAAPNIKDLVQVSLTPSSPTAHAGQKLTLAITFNLAPRWHIYWLNPGDSGMPTSFKFKLPPGWTHSEVRHPVPYRFSQPGDFVGYGYKEQATFLVDLTPPDSFTSGSAEIVVDTVFLACDEICIPGQERLVLTLNHGDPYTAGRAEQFAAWEAEIPVRSPADSVAAATTQVNDKSATPQEFTVRHGLPPGRYTQATFFPNPPAGLEVTDITTDLAATEVVIKFNAKLYSGKTIDKPSIPAVIVFGGTDVRRVAYQLDLPLVAPPQPK